MKVGGSKQNDTGAKMYALGYDYPLSKRTSLGVSYAVINNDSSASYGLYNRSAADLNAPTAGQDTKQFYVGVRHAF
jgi:predicted porin